MTLPATIGTFLQQARIDYQVISHNFTENAYDSACAAHLPTSNVIKAVLLKDHRASHYLLAIIPASNKLNLDWINAELEQNLLLADEMELAARFPDCAMGAVPAIGQAYNLELIWDDQLAQQPSLYFEAGNHLELVHISKADFKQLFKSCRHSVISLPAEHYSIYHSNPSSGHLH